MSAIYAYIRLPYIKIVDPGGADSNDSLEAAEAQRLVLQKYAMQGHLHIADFIEVASAGTTRQRRIEQLCARLHAGDRLLVAELSNLGSSTGEVIVLLDQLLAAGVAVTIVEAQLHLERNDEDAAAQAASSVIALLAQAEKQYFSQRTKNAAVAHEAKGAKGSTLGKPKGTIQASIYDKDRGRIEELLRLGVSQRRIVERHLGYGTSNSLNHYIRTRGLAAEPGSKSGADTHTVKHKGERPCRSGRKH